MPPTPSANPPAGLAAKFAARLHQWGGPGWHDGTLPEDVRIRELIGLVQREPGGSPSTEEVHASHSALESTPRSEWLRADWIRLLTREVKAVRETVFGSTEPPFSGRRWAEAVAWIETELEREVEGARDAAAVLESEEYRRRRDRARADAKWLAERTGLPFRLALAPRPSVSYRLAEDCAEEVATVHPLVRGTALFGLAEASESIANLTGFEPQEVTAWILSGEPPSLPRTYVHAYFLLQAGPNRRTRRVPRVTVGFLVPGLRHVDLRELRRAVDEAWQRLREAQDPRGTAKAAARRTPLSPEIRERHTAALEMDPSPRGRDSARRSRLADADNVLSAIVEVMGGPPSRSTEHTWEEVRARWHAEGNDEGRLAPVTAEALRKRWARLPAKIDPVLAADTVARPNQ